MIDRILLSKARSIERCVRRAREEYARNPVGFDSDYSVQDAAILNLIRACEQAIDMANRLIHLRQLTIPDEGKKAFVELHRAGFLPAPLLEPLRSMVGFRNIAVHEYEELDISKVRMIIEHRLDDLLAFSKAMLLADPSA